MFTTLVFAAIIAAPLTAEEAIEYFPLNTGDKWVYEDKGDDGSMRVTDVVGEMTEINGFKTMPVITSSRNKELDRVYYVSDKSMIRIVAFNAENPLMDPYAIFQMPSEGSRWNHIGDTMMGDAPADLEMKGSVKKVGKREFDGNKFDAIEIRLEATLLAKLGTAFTVTQVAIYGKGIGLISMNMETKLPRRKIKSTRKLVSYTPKSSG